MKQESNTVQRKELFTGDEWRVEKSDGKFPTLSIVVGDKGEASTICTLFTAMSDLKDQQEANAAIIAQAPEMYRLIEWISKVTNSYEIGIKCDKLLDKANSLNK